MGIVASRHLSAETEHQIQMETGFSPYHIDYLLGQYQSLERDAEGVVLRSELLKVPPVAMHPLADRLVDVHLHPSKDFRHFISGLSRFRHSVPLEQKVASIVSMYDTAGAGLLSVGQCDELIRRLPSTRREQRAMRWKLKMLISTESLHEQQQLLQRKMIRQQEMDQQRQSQQIRDNQELGRQQTQSMRASEMKNQQNIQKLHREQGDSINQLSIAQQEQHQEQFTRSSPDKLHRVHQQQQQEREESKQLIERCTEQREEAGDQRRTRESSWQFKYEREELAEFLELEKRCKQEQVKQLEQPKQHDFKTLRLKQREELQKQQEKQQQISNLKELRKELQQQPQDNKGRINCDDIVYITRGIDLDQSLSLRFN